jgi:hypothetical protein
LSFTLCPSFRLAQVLRLWEALWAGVPGLNLFVVVAVLEHHRRRILRHAHVEIGRIGTT